MLAKTVIARFFLFVPLLAGPLLSHEVFAGTVTKEAYLASPLGFSESGAIFKDRVLVPLIRSRGYLVIDPWQGPETLQIQRALKLPPGDRRRTILTELDQRIGQSNERSLQRADIVIAVLDGVDVDSGTASEIGYAYALHKKIIAYRGDFRIASENEGASVSLQVEHFIRASGGVIATSTSELSRLLAVERLAKSSHTVPLHSVAAEYSARTSTTPPSNSDQVSEVVTFFARFFAILLALAVGEAFKQFLTDRQDEGIHWLRLFALGSFLFLVFPFFQGMDRYFSATYGASASLPQPYAPYLMVDGMAFTLEAALFFLMSRSLSPNRWKTFYWSVFSLLLLDTAWATFANWAHGSPVGPWIWLNVLLAVTLGMIVTLIPKSGSRVHLPQCACLMAVFLRTAMDYYFDWNFYFPPPT